jgi:predicted DNA-binding transcriptional regulator AlpA
MPERLIDSEELREWLHVPVRTLDDWSYRHQGPPFVRIGRHRRYDPADVREWLEQCKDRRDRPAEGVSRLRRSS